MKYGRVKRTYRRKRYVKKTYRKKRLTKYIAKVAGRVVRRVAETKTYYYGLGTSNWFNNSFKAWNVFYPIGQGTGDSQRIGDKIQPVSAQLSGVFYTNDINTTNSQTTIRIMVVQNRYQQTNGVVTYQFTDWAGPNPIKVGDAIRGFIDTEQFTVLRDYKIQINPLNNTQTVNNRYVKINIPMPKNFQYGSDNGGYGKFKNYYVLVAVYNSGNGPNNYIRFDGNFKLLFKDL